MTRYVLFVLPFLLSACQLFEDGERLGATVGTALGAASHKAVIGDWIGAAVAGLVTGLGTWLGWSKYKKRKNAKQ